MSNPFFSIILPVYNVDKYLRECLHSLENQTCQDFELIAVNDGSTDMSLEILKEYKDQGQLNLNIITQENGGLSSARNSALNFIKGKYTYFLDSDDYIEKNMLEILKRKLTKSNADIIKFDAQPFLDKDFNSTIIEDEYELSGLLKEGLIYKRNAFFKKTKKKFLAPVWLYCVKTEIIKKNSLTFKEGLIHEDELFTPILFVHCTTFEYVNMRFFNRRYREGSIMTSNNKKKISIENYQIVNKELEKYLVNYNLSKDDTSFIMDRISAISYIIHSIDITNEIITKNYNYSKLSFSKKIKLFVKRRRI